jgi:hypothetical protein
MKIRREMVMGATLRRDPCLARYAGANPARHLTWDTLASAL